MSEPEPRPSWMPSDEELWDSVAPMVDFDHGDTRAMEGVKLLIERAALKAQIEALEEWSECPMTDPDRGSYWADCNDYTVNSQLRSPELCSRCKEIEHLRARLAELEAKP